MTDFIYKFQLLNPDAKKELLDFLDFLLIKNAKIKSKQKKISSYKKNILSVSVWSDNDINEMESDIKNFGTWQIEKW